MRLKIALIRHGETENSDGGPLGIADGDLSERGKNVIRTKCSSNAYPILRHVYSSELACCRETANIIYSSPVIILKALGMPDYVSPDGQAISGIKPASKGSIINDANARAGNVIREISAEMEIKKAEQCAIISHKMIILAILRRYCVPRSSYEDWELPFGGGYVIDYDSVESTANLISNI